MLEEPFSDRDGIAGHNGKRLRVIVAGHRFAVEVKDFFTAVDIAFDDDVRGVGQAGEAAGHADGLEQAHAPLVPQIVIAGLLDLAEHGDMPVGIAQHGQRDLGIDQETCVEKIVNGARGGLDGLAAHLHAADEREDDRAVLGDAQGRAEIIFLVNLHVNEVVCREAVIGRRDRPGGLRAGDRLCRSGILGADSLEEGDGCRDEQPFGYECLFHGFMVFPFVVRLWVGVG